MERTSVGLFGSRRMPRLLTMLGIWMLAAILTPAELKAGENLLATVGDREVTAREIEQSLAIPLYDLEMEKYRLMRRRLDQKIAEELLTRAANEAGKSVSVYVTEQVQAQLASVSDDDVEARYRAETDSGALSASENGNGQLAKQRIRNLLLRERASQGVQMLIQRLKDEAKVSIELRPPDPPVGVVPGCAWPPHLRDREPGGAQEVQGQLRDRRLGRGLPPDGVVRDQAPDRNGPLQAQHLESR